MKARPERSVCLFFLMPIAATARIAPTARVSDRAEIGEGVEIGDFCIVESDVVVGPGTRVEP